MSGYLKKPTRSDYSNKPAPLTHFIYNRRLSDHVTKTTNLIDRGLDYSFGVEFESCAGVINPWVWKYHGLDMTCERDGSVSGGEYITEILRGDEGFHRLRYYCDVLSQRLTYDETCGIHVHIGNAEFNANFIVSAYILCLKIQNGS